MKHSRIAPIVFFSSIASALAGTPIPLETVHSILTSHAYEKCGLQSKLTRQTTLEGSAHRLEIGTSQAKVLAEDYQVGKGLRASSCNDTGNGIECVGDLQVSIDAAAQTETCVENTAMIYQQSDRYSIQVDFLRSSWTAQYPETCDAARARQKGSIGFEIVDSCPGN